MNSELYISKQTDVGFQEFAVLCLWCAPVELETLHTQCCLAPPLQARSQTLRTRSRARGSPVSAGALIVKSARAQFALALSLQVVANSYARLIG